MRIDTAKVDKYGRIKIDNEAVNLSSVQPGDVVLLKIRWDQVEIVDASQQKIAVAPRPYMDKGQNIDWKYHLQLFRSKPRSLPYAAIFKSLPESIQSWILKGTGDDRRSRVSWVLRMLDTYSLEDIAIVLSDVLTEFSHDQSHLEHRLYRLCHPERTFDPIVESYTLLGLVGLEPDVKKYDLLHRKVVNDDEASVKTAL
ncbi:hypothetical protein [Brevibacillus parabrevis]|uniref:hypothetical protein n=1 Tax=Brevibacillus parabrevis TaxID=54914 RepID=UPI002E20CC4E|nr:hypothetical protein [Brevibacillus parabrevis]